MPLPSPGPPTPASTTTAPINNSSASTTKTKIGWSGSGLAQGASGTNSRPRSPTNSKKGSTHSQPITVHLHGYEGYDISEFGQKFIHISTSNGIGNKDHFLGIAFLALGGGCIIVLIVFIAKLVTEVRERPKNL